MTRFSPGRGPIIVEAEVSGPVKATTTRLILDTGTTTTLIDSSVLIAIGYDPELVTQRVPVVTVDGTSLAPRIMLNRLSALGQHRLGLPVVCRDMPMESGVYGLLGLDFLRETVLSIDFRHGRIELA
jgi:predicted aspartyl protease